MPAQSRDRFLVGLALVVGLTGAVFALQGLGAPIGRSFMIGDLRWTAIGLVMLGLAAVLAWWEWRRT
ncbi:MAG TPA: hypothetical protein VFW20_06440 [Candidatus Limnocylindrales bacterium]|nr:hypothetical protein [Candidatus Limnocylindrales bacterium]